MNRISNGQDPEERSTMLVKKAKGEREDLKKLELIKKAQILREVNHAFKKSNENNEWSMEDWMLLGRLVPWQSMVNHSWL